MVYLRKGDKNGLKRREKLLRNLKERASTWVGEAEEETEPK